jgi:hypothetical protein
MHLASRLARSHDEAAAVGAVLGDDHPLACVLRRLDIARERLLVVAALLLVSVVATVEGVPRALPVTVAAAVVGAILGCAVTTLAATKRELACDLIADGRRHLPFDVVERQRQHLLDPSHRCALARWLESLRDDAEHPALGFPAVRPIFSVRVVRTVAPELSEIARLLRSESPGLRGIARMDRLLRDGSSALYGYDAERLRQELRQIRFLLDES